MERFVDEVLVLSKIDYGEADQVVSLFGRNSGRISAFAAGARKSKRRFAGVLEAGSFLRANLVRGRGDVERLEGADLLESFFRLRSDLARISRAMYCLELCREMTAERQANAALFDSLLNYLRALERNEAGPTSLIAFELDALLALGYRPEFLQCTRCHAPLIEGFRFDVERGGSICTACVKQLQHSLPVPASLLQALGNIQHGAREPMPKPARASARKLLNAFVHHHLGKQLKTEKFMADVDID